MAARAKVSVTIRNDILTEVEGLAGERSRSAVFEEALSWWARQRRREALDRAIEDYYRGVRPPEADEDQAWASLGDETVREQWRR